MGFDGLLSFFIRSFTKNNFDDINLETNYTKIVSENIIIDVSFILYNCYNELEDEINMILKNIYGLEFTNYEIIISNLENIFMNEHWDLNDIDFNGKDTNEIYDFFIKYLMDNNNKNFLKILSKYTINKIIKLTDTIFYSKFINNIILFFDSIPSYSKILEQRKRRIKNYKESKNRKDYYNNYKELENNIIKEDNIEYDYIKWYNNKFSCSKIIDSHSDFVNILKEEIYKETSNLIYNIDFDNYMYGEADYKIFRYINEKKLKNNISILSCDSDLLYQSVLQQCNYNYVNSNINIKLIKFYNNSNDYCQLFDSNIIINTINEKYCSYNKISKFNFAYDFLFILLFFGNDFIPTSSELGSEITIEQLIKTHYIAIKDTNVIENDINIGKKINFNKFKLWLIELNKLNLETKKILIKQYKTPYQLINYFIENYDYNVEQIKNNILEPYLYYKGSIMDNLVYNDIRKIIFLKNKDSEDFNCDNIKKFDEFDILCEQYLNFSDIEHYGLYNDSFEIDLTNNVYDNLYNFIHKKSSINRYEFNKKYNINNNIIYNYLLIINFFVQHFFNNFNTYKSHNLIFYKYDIVPKLIDLINYIDKIDEIIIEKINYDINNSVVEQNTYFDNILHHLIITPYIFENNFIDNLNNSEFVKSIIEKFDDELLKIFNYDENDYIYDIEPNYILTKFKEIIDIINNPNLIVDI